ncbi:MAG TPA: caspase family protein, partial [Saprospiraceae bacterium]|nr:caspase family protein [Saprospiraceae bacterium]
FAYADGSKYEGNFANGKFEGQGIFYFSNGDRYVGSFKENYPDGRGSRYFKDQPEQTQEGDWKQGEFLGSSLVEGGKIGCIQGDCENGKGTYVYKEGAAKYVGSFEDSQPEGFGICTYANGDRYRGEWSEGSFDGKGTLTLRDGTAVSGYWRGGEYVGKEAPENYKPVADAPADFHKKEEEPIKTAEQPDGTPTPADPLAKVWAVVVGVASYDHMPALRYTDDDAYRFYAFLKGLEGGALPDDQVRILIDEDATRENVLTSLSEVFAKASPNDLVLFYFSGHGLNGSFLPIDFDGFNNKLLHEEIAAAFNKSKAKYRLLLADACHSGSIVAMRSGDPEPALVQFYKNLSKSVSGTALIMSSKADETSLESAGLRQGVFSHFLIRGLKGEADKDKNKTVTVEELFEYVSKNVRDYTGNRQSPVIKGTYDPAMPVSLVRG